MNCKQCGQELAEDSKFCFVCGAPVFFEAPPQPVVAPDVSPVPPPLPAAAPKKKRGLLWGGIGLAVVAVAVALVLLLSPASGAVNHVVYSKLGGIRSANLSTLETFKISGDASSLYSSQLFTFITDDGRYFYHSEPDGSSAYTLYRTDLSMNPKDKKATVKLDDGVSYYCDWIPGNKIVYIKTSNRGLYISDGKDRKKIASDASYYILNADVNKLVYVTRDDAIYMVSLDTLAEEKVVSEGAFAGVDTTMTTVYYAKDDKLYAKAAGQDKQKITSGYAQMVSIREDGTLLYTKADTRTVQLGDFINDDMADADANAIEPNIADYETYELVGSAWFGYEYQTVTDYDAYETAYETYNQKVYRDTIRADAKAQTLDLSDVALYSYKDGAETKITDCFQGVIDGYGNGLLIYNKYKAQMPDKLNISEIDDLYAVYELFNTYRSSEKAAYATDGQSELMITDEWAPSFLADGNTVYYIDDYDSDDAAGTLNRVTLNGGALSAPEVIDKDISLFAVEPVTKTLLYMKEVERDHGDLYMNGEKVDSDVYRYGLALTPDGRTLYYYTDFSSHTQTGTIIRYNGAKTQKIDRDAAFMTLAGSRLIYLADFSTSSHRGDLYVFDGAEPKELDNNVDFIFDTGLYAKNRPFVYFISQNNNDAETPPVEYAVEAP